MIRENKKRVALVVFGLVVAVLIIEGLLRLLGSGFYYLQGRQNSNSTLSKDVQLNQAEYLQLNRIERKEIVIVCIGESTTGLGAGNSWPSQLQRILNSTQDQKTFRVINKGIPGIKTNEIFNNLPGYLEKYKPDLVLAMVGINDPRYAHRFDKSIPEKTSSSQFWWTNLLSHFRTYGLIKWIADGIKVRIVKNTEGVKKANVAGVGDNEEKLPAYNLADPEVTHLHPQTIRNLNDMVNLTIERGINFVFVQYALRKTDILRNVIERKNVFYISNYEIFLDLLNRYNYEDLFWDNFGGDFGHATPFGNRVIADNVAQQLLNLFEL